MELTEQYLMDHGWSQDRDLYWHKNGHEYNFIDKILWLKGSKHGIWEIDTIKKLKEAINAINGNS